MQSRVVLPCLRISQSDELLYTVAARLAQYKSFTFTLHDCCCTQCHVDKSKTCNLIKTFAGDEFYYIYQILSDVRQQLSLTPLLLSLPTAAYLGQRGSTPAGLLHTTAQCHLTILGEAVLCCLNRPSFRTPGSLSLSSCYAELLTIMQAATVRHEMLLLSNMLQLDDSLWEQRVRCGQYVQQCFLDCIVVSNQQKPVEWLKMLKCYTFSSETNLRATEHHLPYEIAQCYLPPNTGERAPP